MKTRPSTRIPTTSAPAGGQVLQRHGLKPFGDTAQQGFNALADIIVIGQVGPVDKQLEQVGQVHAGQFAHQHPAITLAFLHVTMLGQLVQHQAQLVIADLHLLAQLYRRQAAALHLSRIQHQQDFDCIQKTPPRFKAAPPGPALPVRQGRVNTAPASTTIHRQYTHSRKMGMLAKAPYTSW
jgi:hypothetical protein